MRNAGRPVPVDTRRTGASISDANMLALTAVVIATVLALAIRQLRLDGAIGANFAAVLAVLVAAAHFAVVLLAAIRTRRIAWSLYLLLTAAAFIAIGAVTPISAALSLLRLVVSV